MKLPTAEQIRKAKEYIIPAEEVSHADEREAIDVVFNSGISTLEKVYALDKIYNCNLKLSEDEYRSLSKRLRGVEERIKSAEDYKTADAIVEEISLWECKSCKRIKRIGTVFASKYCYFTKRQPEGLFIIYDKYADMALTYLYLEATNAVQRYWGNYKGYASKVRELLQQLKGEGIHYRDIDKYLWLFGQVLSAIDKPDTAPTRIKRLDKEKLAQLKRSLDPLEEGTP